MNDREFDIIVWGATGFTGRLTAGHLLERHGVGPNLRWALGGRNERKLEKVRSDLARECGISTEGLPIVLADAGDEASIRALTARTRVVCTTVGPYALHGSPLVAACAEGGTHYCDLTGEAHWMRRMIDVHEDTARSTGARIVFACGFDCIPADLGTFFLQSRMRAHHGVTAREVKFRVKGFSGGASGGTIASMINMLEEGSRDREILRIMRDPYALNPPSARSGPDEPERMRPAWDPDFGEWVAPFVMAVVDTKVVRRTNALLDFDYGRDFRYNEAVLTGRGPAGFARASGVTAALAATMATMSIGPLRRLARPRLPAPGEGPSREARENGYFDLRFLGRHPSDPTRNLRARVTGDRDPGYGSTSRMLGESALCLALDDLPTRAGMLTPAAAMGEALLVRLQKNAGLSFAIEPEENG